MSSPPMPSRGEIWMADLGVGLGHEQFGIRPVLIVSVDGLNHSPADLAIVIPLTSRKKRVRTHVEVIPPEGGLSLASYIKCEDARSISTERLNRVMGSVSPKTMAEVEFNTTAQNVYLIYDTTIYQIMSYVKT